MPYISRSYEIMVSSDLDALIEMGFDKERAEIALKRSGGCMLFFGDSEPW